MNKRGQIFTLDFILAFVLIILTIGFSINYFESSSLNISEQSIRNELKIAAKTASDTLTHSPIVICDLVNVTSGHIDYLPNCLSSDVTISKRDLGIHSELNCSVEEIGSSFITFSQPGADEWCDPNNDSSSAKNVVSIDRKVVVKNLGDPQEITKAELLDCQRDLLPGVDCVLVETTINVKVWK